MEVHFYLESKRGLTGPAKTGAAGPLTTGPDKGPILHYKLGLNRHEITIRPI